MFAFSLSNRAWIRRVQAPFWVSLLSMASVGGVVVAGQWVLLAPIVPNPVGIARIWLGLAPEMIGVLAPVAILFASVTVARLWHEGGEIRAMSCTGCSPVMLIRGGLFMGLMVGVGVALCTHVLAPYGRSDARQTLMRSLADLPLRARAPTQIGDLWLRVEDVDGRVGRNVVVATGDWVAWAERGELSESGLHLENGQARPLDGRWTARYSSAQFPIAMPTVGVHNFERTSSALWHRVLEKQARGDSAVRDKLTLHKRTTLPLSAPLFALLGIPLGLTFRYPAWVTTGVVVMVWVVQRLGDHLAVFLGAELVAAAPLLLLVLATGAAWRRVWGQR